MSWERLDIFIKTVGNRELAVEVTVMGDDPNRPRLYSYTTGVIEDKLFVPLMHIRHAELPSYVELLTRAATQVAIRAAATDSKPQNVYTAEKPKDRTGFQPTLGDVLRQKLNGHQTFPEGGE